MSSYLLPTYKRQPISFVKGQGSYLYICLYTHL